MRKPLIIPKAWFEKMAKREEAAGNPPCEAGTSKRRVVR